VTGAPPQRLRCGGVVVWGVGVAWVVGNGLGLGLGIGNGIGIGIGIGCAIGCGRGWGAVMYIAAGVWRGEVGEGSTVGGGEVQYREFEALARRYWEEIPEAYKEGVDGLVVERDAKPHPTLGDIYTLGECLTETYPSEYGGPETIRSAVVLYYGSFWRLSRLDPEFDWEEELWETLTHELKHHLESLADEDALIALDYAMDENFKRLEGEPFDPYFYRSGERVAEGVWRVERDTFLEREYASAEPPGPEAEFDWHGGRYRVPVPEDPGDVCFLWIEEGLERGPGEEVYLVLVRRAGFGESLRALFGRRRVEVREASVRAVAVAGGGGQAGRSTVAG